MAEPKHRVWSGKGRKAESADKKWDAANGPYLSDKRVFPLSCVKGESLKAFEEENDGIGA